MRILQICTNFLPGGIQRHVLDLTADLRGMGHTVRLAGDIGDWRPADALPLPLRAVAGTGGSLPRRLAAIPRAAWVLRRYLKAERIELIHAHETAPALVARLASLGLKIPVAMTFHGAAPAREPEVARIGRLCADIVISPSRDGLARLVAHGLPAARGRALGLGVPALPPVAPESAAALRDRIRAGRPGPLVISLSRLDRQKGLDVMIQVARQLRSQHPGAVFAVAGKGPLAGEVGGWAQAAGVAGSMVFLGAISTVAEHLKAADLFLLTSRWENLPISIVEAFRAGRPVVATDCGGVRELVDDEVGALCPVGDAGAIAAAVGNLLADPQALARKGAAALARSAEPRFDPATVHARFEALYREMLG